MDKKEIALRAVYAVASQFGYKADPIAYARELLAKEPQLWAAEIVENEIKADGFRVTKARKAAIWAAVGGKEG
jgi:hypothetical protein